ncbi:GDP-mannose 4,6-dehydratase [Alkalihalobacillus sp. LMS39]|uniref:GDP-mannose 4,6-dehydratase n=1 Tax=Alkalihalobacillus sp. LMS39 TaxID=2924032 RepID=UPI001FB1CFDD|nr:GDP-mannose 4,6-dehydratase [Alkalihalobacillus sp. LMS39]UOE93819.1 GDP-mannose 4,6-dehydratase [Alkalihalobacillus sp. LMS39]
MGKVLVTGGAGFIGSHVVDHLVNQGKEVIIVDNLSTGKLEYVNQSELVSFYEVDITEKEKLEDVFFTHQGIASIIHLAAQSKVGPSVENPILDATINIDGTIHVLEFARKYGIQTFIYASSAAVYGPVETLPIKEEEKLQPLSPYGVSKLAAEEYIKAYGRLYGFDVFALRFANVYGPRQSVATEAGVITIFIDQLLADKQVVVYGDGEQTRDFVYVEDVAKAVLRCLLYDGKLDEMVFNVSTNTETSVASLLQIICNEIGVTYTPQFEEERPGDIKESYLANDKLKSSLGWKPTVSLEQGLEKTIEWSKRR